MACAVGAGSEVCIRLDWGGGDIGGGGDGGGDDGGGDDGGGDMMASETRRGSCLFRGVASVVGESPTLQRSERKLIRD